MKKRRTLQRFLAVCLCLIVVILACACASVDAPSGDSKETSALELSEMNAELTSSEAEPSDEESSQAEPSDDSSETEPSTSEDHISADDDASLSGDITITPIEPVIPEERETTLELVKEYPLGEDGIPFYLEYYDDPENAGISTPTNYAVDENGKLYVQIGNYIFDIEDNKEIELENGASQWYVSNGKVYSITRKGLFDVHSMNGELISSRQFVIDSTPESIDLYLTDEGIPRIRIGDDLFSADGKKAVSRFSIEQNQNTITVNGVINEVVADDGFAIMGDMAGALTVKNNRLHSYEDRSCIAEQIVCQFGADGNPISEFAIYQLWSPKDLPCNVVSGDVVCKWYRGWDIKIGKTDFEGVLSRDYFVGADNQFYALMIYPDRAELYRVNPGYSDVTPIDFDKMGDSADF